MNMSARVIRIPGGKEYRTIGIPGTETGVKGLSAGDYGTGFSHPRTKGQPAH